MRTFVFWFCFAFVISSFGAEIKFDFSRYSPGETPTNFHSALAGGGKPGDWKIVMDRGPSAFTPLTPQAPDVNRQAVLAQTSQDPTDNRFPMFIYDGGTFKDFTLKTRFEIVAGGLEQMAGVVFRYQNESNFFVFRASALGGNVRFYKVINGQFASAINLATNISTKVWHSLTVECDGNRILCGFDGSPVIKVVDNTPANTSGKIGFWTKSDAVSYFCDASISYTPNVPAAQSLVQSIMQKYPRILGLRIYTADGKGQPHIIASKDEKEIGRAGTTAEKSAIEKGKIFFGRGDGTVALTLPLRDRNGDPMAAVHVELKSFPGETQDTALTRAMIVLKDMQAQVLSLSDLTN